VSLALGDQAYTGERAREAFQQAGMELVVLKVPEAREGFVLVPKRQVVERSFGWLSRFRRLARDYERLATVLRGFHFLAFTWLLLHRVSA
jgi:transposase